MDLKDFWWRITHVTKVTRTSVETPSLLRGIHITSVTEVLFSGKALPVLISARQCQNRRLYRRSRVKVTALNWQGAGKKMYKKIMYIYTHTSKCVQWTRLVGILPQIFFYFKQRNAKILCFNIWYGVLCTSVYVYKALHSLYFACDPNLLGN